MKSQVMTLREAAQILGIGVPEIRMRMRSKELPIGIALPPKKGNKHWMYRVYRSKLNAFLEIEEDEEDEQNSGDVRIGF